MQIYDWVKQKISLLSKQPLPQAQPNKQHSVRTYRNQSMRFIFMQRMKKANNSKRALEKRRGFTKRVGNYKFI